MVGSPGFEPGSREPKASLNWDDFKVWLQSEHAKSTVFGLLRYARKYSYVLYDPTKMVDLQGLSRDKRRNVMSALANLSRFIGVYDQ